MKYIGNLPELNIVHTHADRYDYVFASNPTIDINPSVPNCNWLNSATGEVFICTDNTIGANIWEGSNHVLFGIDAQTGDDIVIPITEGTKAFSLLAFLKGTSTTSTSIYHGVNGDTSATYDRRYYVLGSNVNDVQISNVPSAGGINSYGITEIELIVTVSALGLTISSFYSRLSDAGNVVGENVVITKEAITSLSEYRLHLADTNNEFVAGSNVLYKRLY